MNILTEIHRRDGINIHGSTIHRIAVRGVILRGRTLLMVHSSSVGDYKFPGGGLAKGETHAHALRREVLEECGTSVVHIGPGIGAIIEYNRPVEKDYDVFKMTSYYYQCEVADGFGAQTLDEYERGLGFKPVWIDIDDAIQYNQALLHSDNMPEWLKREIFLLEHIRQNLLVNMKPGT